MTVEQQWGHIFGSIDEAALDQAVRQCPEILDYCRRKHPAETFALGARLLAEIRAKYHAILAERNAA